MLLVYLTQGKYNALWTRLLHWCSAWPAHFISQKRATSASLSMNLRHYRKLPWYREKGLSISKSIGSCRFWKRSWLVSSVHRQGQMSSVSFASLSQYVATILVAAALAQLLLYFRLPFPTHTLRSLISIARRKRRDTFLKLRSIFSFNFLPLLVRLLPATVSSVRDSCL